tara:strand:+ start:2389 stop:2541 length:153 start_codon:yes stop_codon:yes gene_type:complete
VKFAVDTLQAAMFDVGIDLSGLDAGVAKHLLDLTEVRTASEEMCGKTVPQ